MFVRAPLCAGALWWHLWFLLFRIKLTFYRSSSHSYVCLSSFQEKLMYFPVCVSNKKKSEDETEEGLGSLPRNISSVSSLLLFNTTENLWVQTHTLTQIDTNANYKRWRLNENLCIFFCVFYRYKKYVFLDPLAGAVTKTHTTLETEKEEKPFDAPLSITKREQLERQVETSSNHNILSMWTLLILPLFTGFF